jgi:hypothetical protein
VGLARVQSSCVRLLAHHRPHVSISEAFPPAVAACGIPPDTPCGWHLLTTTRESTGQVYVVPRLHWSTPSGDAIQPGFMAVHTGQEGTCQRLSCAILAPALQPLTLGDGDDGSPRLRWRSPEVPARRDFRMRLPDTAVSPRFRPLRTSRRSGGYTFTPCTWRKGLSPLWRLSYKTNVLRLAREHTLSFSQRLAHPAPSCEACPAPARAALLQPLVWCAPEGAATILMALGFFTAVCLDELQSFVQIILLFT